MLLFLHLSGGWITEQNVTFHRDLGNSLIADTMLVGTETVNADTICRPSCHLREAKVSTSRISEEASDCCYIENFFLVE
jgi:hypothetical protein